MLRKRIPSVVRIVLYVVIVIATGSPTYTQARFKFFNASKPQIPQFKTRVGETLPDFELRDLSGKVWRSSDLKGKVVFINVWAWW